MSEALKIRYNEKTGLWEKHEPFMTIDVMTEEDYNTLNAAVEHYRKRGKWINGRYNDWQGNVYEEQCSYCGRYSKDYGRPYCSNCGAGMDAGDPVDPVEKKE